MRIVPIILVLLFMAIAIYFEIQAMYHCGWWTILLGKATIWAWATGFCSG